MNSTTMKAIEYSTYGGTEVLQLKEVNKITPNDKEVLIRIYARTVTIVDTIFRSGKDFNAKLYTGLFRPKNSILGGDLAGEIVRIGKDVKRFKVGDKVFGATADGFGSLSEYICLPESSALVSKPENMSYIDAISIPYGALTALPFLRDGAKIKKGQKVLINGASGPVGIAAIQLAKFFGAKVTAVCSTTNLEFVKSLGADYVIDYTKEQFIALGETYDIIFDVVGKSSFSTSKVALTTNGIYLSAVLKIGTLLQMLWTSKFGTKKAAFLATGLRKAEEQISDLNFIKELIAMKKLRPIVANVYDWNDFRQAHEVVEKGRQQGTVILKS